MFGMCLYYWPDRRFGGTALLRHPSSLRIHARQGSLPCTVRVPRGARLRTGAVAVDEWEDHLHSDQFRERFQALRQHVQHLYQAAAPATSTQPVLQPVLEGLDAAQESMGEQLWTVVAVCDEGIGIPATDLPHIFDRFHRAGNIARQIRGTGLGLMSARQVVEQHGGAISVESTEGCGSTFTVCLPLEPPRSQEYAIAPESELLQRAGATIEWTTIAQLRQA
jgi:signal transduction histidine kinase